MFNLNRQTENLLAFLAQAQRARATEYGERGFRFVDLNARDAATTSTNLSKKFEVRYCLTCGKIVTYPCGAWHIPSRHITIPLSWVRLWCLLWDHHWSKPAGDESWCLNCLTPMSQSENERGLFLKVRLQSLGERITAQRGGDIPTKDSA